MELLVDSTASAPDAIRLLSQTAQKRPVADVVVEYLVAAGVRKVFGVPGGATIPFHMSLEKHDEIDFVLTRHEGGAAFMADCYARVSGGLGVCCATTGPGATNLMTGVGAAYMDSVPVLAITGMNPIDSWGRGDFQECTPYAGVNTTDMFRSLCKSSEVVVSEKLIQYRLRNAIATALSGRPGPVHLAIPRDLWGRRIAAEPFALGKHLALPSAPAPNQLNAVARLLLGAVRPLIICGSGTSRQATAHLFEIADRFSIPIVTTPRGKGKGAPALARAYLGNTGISATPVVDDLIKSFTFDVVLTVGAGFGSYATNSWDPRIVPTRAMIQINIDPNALGRTFPADIAIVADSTQFAEMLHDLMTSKTPDALSRSRAAWMAQWTRREKWTFPPRVHHKIGDSIHPIEIIRAVDQVVGEQGLILADSNSILLWATHYLPERAGRRFIGAWGSASMGHMTAGAVGAKLAAPRADVVALVGDGCFLMNGTEVATAVDLGLPIVWVINVNAQLGMIHYELRASGLVGSTTLRSYDFSGFARSLGANGVRCDNPDNLAALIAAGLRDRRPTVIQVDVDPLVTPPMGMKKEGSAQWKAYVEQI